MFPWKQTQIAPTRVLWDLCFFSIMHTENNIYITNGDSLFNGFRAMDCRVQWCLSYLLLYLSGSVHDLSLPTLAAILTISSIALTFPWGVAFPTLSNVFIMTLSPVVVRLYFRSRLFRTSVISAYRKTQWVLALARFCVVHVARAGVAPMYYLLCTNILDSHHGAPGISRNNVVFYIFSVCSGRIVWEIPAILFRFQLYWWPVTVFRT